MIAPASRQLAERFDIHSTVLLAMTTSVFVLAYGAYLSFSIPLAGLVHSRLRSYHSFWAAIPWPTQRDIRPLPCATSFKSVVPQYVLYMLSRWRLMMPLYRLVWNTACGFARSKDQLIAFRFLAGLGGSAPLAIGGGVIGDLFDAEHRGQAIAIYSLAPLLGPVIGPVAGAWIAEKSTWRWVVCFCSASIIFLS